MSDETNQRSNLSSSIPQVGPLTQAIRYHASGDEVHFHVDAEDLTVVITAAGWWAAWEKLKRGESFRFIDHAHGCVLSVTAGVDAKGEFEVVPQLSRLSDESDK